MFELIVLYQWKPGITPERIEHHFAKIRALNGRVPNLIRVTCGPSSMAFGHEAQRWTHRGTMLFRHQNDYKTFGSSAAHDEIAPDLVADLEKLLAVGFDTERAEL